MENLWAQRSSQEILGQQGNWRSGSSKCRMLILFTINSRAVYHLVPNTNSTFGSHRLEEEKQLMKNTFASFNESLNVL